MSAALIFEHVACVLVFRASSLLGSLFLIKHLSKKETTPPPHSPWTLVATRDAHMENSSWTARVGRARAPCRTRATLRPHGAVLSLLKPVLHYFALHYSPQTSLTSCLSLPWGGLRLQVLVLNLQRLLLALRSARRRAP